MGDYYSIAASVGQKVAEQQQETEEVRDLTAVRAGGYHLE